MSDSGFDSTLDQYIALGRLNDDPATLDARLHAAVETAGISAQMQPKDMGLGDWAKEKVDVVKKAVHGEICDESQGKVKDKYLDLINKGTSKEAISWLSSIITTTMVALHLAPLAVASVVLYLAMWILKTNLVNWCRLPG